MNDENKLTIAKAVAEQIGVEQAVVANRLSWNLTFQGFMIASYALVATSAFTEPSRTWIHLIIIVAGILVSVSTFIGVWASRLQSSQLKRHWDEQNLDISGYPRPFAEPLPSLLGRIPPFLICFTISAMWIALLFID